MTLRKLGNLRMWFVIVLTASSLSACTVFHPVQGNIESYNLRQIRLVLPKYAEDIQPRKVLEDIDYNNRVIEKIRHP